jgi:hypothetical protein
MEGKRKTRRPRKRWTEDVDGDLNITGIKKQPVNGERPSGVEEDLTGKRGPEGTVALEEEEKEKRKRKKKKKRGRRSLFICLIFLRR